MRLRDASYTDYGDHYPFTSIFVPPGDYRVTGGFGADLTNVGLWCVPGSATITITDDDAYFLDVPHGLQSLLIEGLRFVGGKGAFRHSWTGANVTKTHRISHNMFTDYVGAALVFEAADMPYIIIEGNLFRPKFASGTTTKGLVIGGLMDNGRIQNNGFENNDIHIQMGPINGGSNLIENNSFLSVETDRLDVAIWLIPNNTVAEKENPEDADSGIFGTNDGPTHPLQQVRQ